MRESSQEVHGIPGISGISIYQSTKRSRAILDLTKDMYKHGNCYLEYKYQHSDYCGWYAGVTGPFTAASITEAFGFPPGYLQGVSDMVGCLDGYCDSRMWHKRQIIERILNERELLRGERMRSREERMDIDNEKEKAMKEVMALATWYTTPAAADHLPGKLPTTPINLPIDEDIVEIPATGPGHGWVYFLLNEETVVYVGQTKVSVGSRLASHRKDKIYTRIIAVRIPLWDLIETEARYITKFNPIYNKKGVAK